MQIIGGPASQMLAARVARELNTEPLLCDFHRFPDGELYTRILDEITEDVTIVQSTVTDSDLIALLQLIDACEGSPSINVVIPYMGYARQDRKFMEGEPVSARAIARTVSADRVYTVNIHEQNVLDYFRCDAFDIDASYLLGDYLASLGLQNPLIVAPDRGAVDIAEKASESSGIEFDYLEKTRLSGDRVSIKTKQMDVGGRDVVLIDDMIATGGTMAESIRILREQNAHDVYLICVHPVLARNAVLRLFNAGVRDLLATDTIEKSQSCISVASLIASELEM